MGAEITLDDVRDWRGREAAHYNGGKEWFGYGYYCIENPRLYWLERCIRKDRSTTVTYSVDGVDCADLAEAVIRLNVPPVVTDEELAVLREMHCGFMTKDELRALEAHSALADPLQTLHHWMPRKGLIYCEQGRVRRTQLGNEIAASPSPKGPDNG